jgi:hypothetical protein
VRAYNSSDCGSGAGSVFILNNAIIVQTPQPHLLITNATVDGNASTTVIPSASVSLKLMLRHGHQVVAKTMTGNQRLIKLGMVAGSVIITNQILTPTEITIRLGI